MNQTFFVGVVENRMGDPLKLGRCQVRVFGVHSESLDDVPTSSLPWAIPLMPATSASLSGIGHSGTQYIEGTTVFVFFQDGESKQQPIIMGSMAGVPLDKSPFGKTNAYLNENFTESHKDTVKTGTVSVQATSGDTLLDSSGTPVLDGSGAPVVTEGTDNTNVCCTGVDSTEAVKKYGSNVTLICKTLCEYGIKDPNAIIAILANVGKECKYKLVREDVTYTTAARLRTKFPAKFGSMTDVDIAPYIGNGEKIANLVYSNRYGNGPEISGDGYRYRGGGFIQLTFKGNYASIGTKIGVDLVSNPDKVLDPSIAAKVVAQYFIDKFGGPNKVTFPTLEAAIVGITGKVNPGGLAADLPIVRKEATLFTGGRDNRETGSIKKPNDPNNDVNRNATKKEIDAGIVSKTSTSNRIGFADPNKKYPLDSLLKEADSNRLTRRVTVDTIVEDKISNNRSGIRSIGSTFSEPRSPYNAQYPFNQVYATESGHVLEFDDTPGNERINMHHTSGTYSEIDKYGNQVNKIMGDNFSITERNGYIYIDGTARITIGSDVKLVIGGNLQVEVDGNITYDVGGDVNYKVGGDLKYDVGGSTSFVADSTFAIDSSLFFLNSGVADSIGHSARAGVSTDHPLQIPENFIGGDAQRFDDADPATVEAYHKDLVASGRVTQKELDVGAAATKNPEKTDDNKPANVPAALPESCSAFANKTSIPDTTQLSKYFTLGMLSSKAPAGHHTVVAQHNLNESQIVCSLKKVAENCLDVIKAKYPNMYPTSGFRNGNSSSQHELGEAVDMQFDVPNSEYFAIAQWIKYNVLFDKLLLEYKSFDSGKAWIHIAYRDNPRREVYTYMNNIKSGNGLQKLQ
jgi:predicted chitinase